MLKNLDCNKRRLDASIVHELLFLIEKDGRPIFHAVKRRGWTVAALDDKALFDDDAENIGRAFAAGGATEFFVACVDKLNLAADVVEAYAFPSTLEGVEQFQSDPWLELNLEDCILFSIPLAGFVFRPGRVETTYAIGPEAFVLGVSSATGWMRQETEMTNEKSKA